MTKFVFEFYTTESKHFEEKDIEIYSINISDAINTFSKLLNIEIILIEDNEYQKKATIHFANNLDGKKVVYKVSY